MATTLALAEQNHAEELKRVCLEYVSKHLSLVIASEGYQHMVNSCPQLQVWCQDIAFAVCPHLELVLRSGGAPSTWPSCAHCLGRVACLLAKPAGWAAATSSQVHYLQGADSGLCCSAE